MAAAKTEGATPAGKMNVHQKLLRIQAQTENVKKAGWHDFNKFSYMQEHHVFELLKPHLDAVGATCVVECSVERPLIIDAPVGNKAKPGHLTTLVGRLTFTDVDTGESITATYIGQALDNEGKGAGKAQTYLVKYALQKFFLIPTEAIEDTDHSEGSEGTQAAEAPARAPAAAPVHEADAGAEEGASAAPASNGVLGEEKAAHLLKTVAEFVKAGELDANKVKAKLATFRIPMTQAGVASLPSDKAVELQSWLNAEVAKSSK